MILVIEDHERNTQKEIRLSTTNDFEYLAYVYPHAEKLLLECRTNEEAIEKFVKYINNTGWHTAKIINEKKMNKAEEMPPQEEIPKIVKLKLDPEEDKEKISEWLKSLSDPPERMRSSNETGDPGYKIDHKEDKDKEIKDGIKMMFKDKK